jgi:hypothetical protein
VKVNTCTLDGYLEYHPVTGSLVIKVDIEGHESAFFRGAAKTIARHKPDIILEVLEDQDPVAVNELKRLGYRFYPITDGDFVELEAPKLIKRYPFLFLTHLLSTRPQQEIQQLLKEMKTETQSIDLRQTSKHFPKEQWPLLWKSEHQDSRCAPAGQCAARFKLLGPAPQNGKTSYPWAILSHTKKTFV